MTALRSAVLLTALWSVAACATGTNPPAPKAAAASTDAANLQLATFAGGCFWSMEKAFHDIPGISRVTAGYTGGHVANPTYEQVSDGDTGHLEAVEIAFDPKVISYAQLLNHFWHHVDPTEAGGQFCDFGPEYKSQIFFHGPEQKRLAEESKKALVDSKELSKPVVTQIVEAGPFYAAEDYHQDYARKNPTRYGMYREGCGRDRQLAALWHGKEKEMPKAMTAEASGASMASPAKWRSRPRWRSRSPAAGAIRTTPRRRRTS